MKVGLLLLIILLSFQSIALAGGVGSSGGGDGIIINGRPVLLDFLEAGVEDQVYVNEGLEISPFIEEKLRKNLGYVPEICNDESFRIIALKLTELEAENPILALTILEAISFYDFRFVNSALVDIPDEQTLITYEPKDLVQLAGRRGYSIMVNRKLWTQLDEYNRAGLIFHEIIYALGSPVTYQDSVRQFSPYARSIVGYLFSKRFQMLGLVKLESLSTGNELQKILLYEFPSFSDAKMASYFSTYRASASLLLYGPRLSVELKDKDGLYTKQDPLTGNSSKKDFEFLCQSGQAIHVSIKGISLQMNPEVSGIKIEREGTVPLLNLPAPSTAQGTDQAASCVDRLGSTLMKYLQKF